MRVAHLNMTQSGATCPQGLTQKDFSGLTLCGRNNIGCQSTLFSTSDLNYFRVCGQLQGYQFGLPDAFYPYRLHNSADMYVDGVSITYGSAPRKHIWTYANGIGLGNFPSSCPCNNYSNNNAQVPPPFVGSDYYCETGVHVYICCADHQFHLYSNDTLWDGQQCFAEEAPCCTHPNMPWFLKTLNETTTEDIELRVCGDQNIGDEDTLLQEIELYVY